MLEKPDLPDERIIAQVQEEYGLRAIQLTFLPLGADANTAVYRLAVHDGQIYFLKLRKGGLAEITLAVPQFLYQQGLLAVIPPIETLSGRLWGSLGAYALILYPFIEGQDNYQVRLSDAQWLAFGAALGKIHQVQLPPNLAQQVPHESFAPTVRDEVRRCLALAESQTFDDPLAIQFAAALRQYKTPIRQMLQQADSLGKQLLSSPPEFVLCHSDIHPGNLHLTQSGELCIVDWDAPIFAPKERDLLLIGGCPGWSDPRQIALFYQAYTAEYAKQPLDPIALAYYRYERILQDIAVESQEVLLSLEGGANRQLEYEYFLSNFLPGGVVELAFQTRSSG